MSPRETKIVFSSYERRDGRTISLWRVVRRDTGETVYGPNTWKYCCLFKQGRAPAGGIH